MSKIIDMFGEFKSDDDKLKFMESQFSVITQLTKQVEQLKKEKQHLEQLLQDATPTIFADDSISDEEKIAKEQLRLLKGVSASRELTKEESTKVDTYAKILLQLKNGNQKKSSPVDNMPVADLLQLVKTDDKNVK